MKLQTLLDTLWFGKIVTLSGRYFAMDRDKKWERTQKTYDCIVDGNIEEEFEDALVCVKQCHKNWETDEFIVPRKHKNYSWFEEQDAVIFFNFRTDRTRQLTPQRTKLTSQNRIAKTVW